MARSAVLGFPRIGPDRELKRALESYWRGELDVDSLEQTARELRALNLRGASGAGIDVLPVGDFAYYDHVLDAAELVGIVADRHAGVDASPIERYFLACRGGEEVRPLEMTKWFDTNYHYLVPELRPNQSFGLEPRKWIEDLREARALGISGRPALLGPVSLLLLSKGVERPLELLGELTRVYRELLRQLETEGATEVQLDEPMVALDRTGPELATFATAYDELGSASDLELCLATYFAGLDDEALARIGELELAELHVDLVRAPDRLDAVIAALGDRTRLSAGVIDGRNVWAADLDAALDRLDRIVDAIGSERLTIAPSCSLLHVPYSAARESGIDPELRSWLAFGEEKLAELALLAEAVDLDAAGRDSLLAQARERTSSRRSSGRTDRSDVRSRAGRLKGADYDRANPIGDRLAAQADRLGLPPLPTTTIGSYPQTDEIREARRKRKADELSEDAYREFLEGEIKRVIGFQEELGIDVLVHGEPERNDMVEYFGERLDGFAFSQSGWVQSYGSRCVKPPILYGDVARPSPMTVEWWRYAQSLTDKPVKGMLTGPVTILQWSFVRDDQPRQETCLQIALAIQDEVADLEAAGAAAIQIDEAALREGLPLRKAEQDQYVRWAVDCFRLTAARARPETQIHSHMCYSEFGEMIEHIGRLDADVISIEASRSGMELLEAFRDYDYPGQIGPGVYDIHSPRVPRAEEIAELLDMAAERIPVEQLWVNPDCGLKTRGWPEVERSLANMVEAASRQRAKLPAPA